MHKPNLDISASVVLSPDAEDILLGPNTDNSTADLVTGLVELVANHGHEEILPIPVANAFFEPHDPLATLFVCFVLPYRAYSFPEEVIIRHT